MIAWNNYSKEIDSKTKIIIVILQYTNTPMGITKSAHFTEAQNQLAMQLKALAHPARIAILEFLLKTDSCICGDIVNELPLSQATVSQHLKEMKNARIIKGTIEGNAICYCIDQDQFNQLTQQMVQINEVLKTKNNQCC